jgi:nucleoside-diphosphate-sugar epimerase
MARISYSKAVIFGAGQVGLTLAEQLTAKGVAVTLVSRRGKTAQPLPAGATLVTGDVTDPATVARLARAGEVVFETAQPEYTKWPQKWPPLAQAIIDGLAQTHTPMVFVDNLYMYGPTHGAPISEDLPYTATGHKGKTRAQIATMFLDAHKAGKFPVTIGRASDYFGPGVRDTAVFGDRFFEAFFAGKAVDLFGKPDLPHTYTYVPDFARALITLSENEEAYGRAWHAPNAATVSTSEMVKLFESELGQPVKTRVVSPLMVSLAALFVPIVREMKEMAYEFNEAYVVDDSQFRAAFGAQTTPLADAVRATVAWAKADHEAKVQAAKTAQSSLQAQKA